MSKDVAIIETAVIDGDFVGLSPAITHPELERPVAFLNDIPVAPLLGTIVTGQTFGHTLEKWSGSISTANGLRILNWMWSPNNYRVDRISDWLERARVGCILSDGVGVVSGDRNDDWP